jgi:hypothetical protein
MSFSSIINKLYKILESRLIVIIITLLLPSIILTSCRSDIEQIQNITYLEFFDKKLPFEM